MNPFQTQNYFELLEVPPTATADEIRAAYERQLALYAPDSVALYVLEDPSQAEALRKLLVEAMEILTDGDLRAEYHQQLGLPPPVIAPAPAPAPLATVTELPVVEAAALAQGAAVASGPALEEPATAPLPAPGMPMPVEAAPVVTAATSPGGPLPEEPAAPELPPAELLPSNVIELVRPSGTAGPEPRGAVAVARQGPGARAVVTLEDPSRTDPRNRTVEITPDTEFNGELLRRVREGRGHSIQQMADRTRISSRHLENIEADRYGALPATVYLRGMLMSLAKELGLEPARVTRSYMDLVGRAGRAAPR